MHSHPSPKAAVPALAAFLLLASCVHPPEAPPAPVVKPTASLFITADLFGYLEPCGCSQNMQGGIDRAAAQLKAARAQGTPVLLIDAGNALFQRQGLEPMEVVQAKRQAQALAQALQQMGLAAKAVGPWDKVLGNAFLSGLDLPLVQTGQARVFPVDGVKVALATGASFSELAGACARARNDGATFVLGAWTGNVEDAERLAQTRATGADLLLALGSPESPRSEQDILVRGEIPLVQLKSKGRSLLRVDLYGGEHPGSFTELPSGEEKQRTLGALTQRIQLLDREINLPDTRPDKRQLLKEKLAQVEARRNTLAQAAFEQPGPGNSLAVRFIPLDASLPTDPAVTAIIHRYDQDVGQLNLAWARQHGQDCPKAKRGEAAYVGNAACRECHAEAFAVYEQTRHAHAYEALVRQGKQYRVDCIACHVIGFDQPGGVCRVDRVLGRMNVGCENCHGPGSLHVANATKKNIRANPQANICRGCHDPENSPHFDYGLFLPHILGPGHGRPLK